MAARANSTGSFSWFRAISLATCAFCRARRLASAPQVVAQRKGQAQVRGARGARGLPNPRSAPNAYRQT
eukprot:2370224-Alexandrium_andersonii.AAC.1